MKAQACCRGAAGVRRCGICVVRTTVEFYGISVCFMACYLLKKRKRALPTPMTVILDQAKVCRLLRACLP